MAALIRLTGSALTMGVMLCTAGCATPPKADPPPPPPAVEPVFTTIFDGTSFDGWEIIVEEGQPFHKDAFYLEDRTLACKGYGYHWFRYVEPQDNFVLSLEFKIAKGSNSGVCLRAKKEGAPPFTGFEVQIVDDSNEQPQHTTGAIYDVIAPAANASKPIGEWNRMEITCHGHKVEVILNGQQVINADFSNYTEPVGKFDFPYSQLPAVGYIALQDHWTPIWYRNIRLKKLPPPAPPQ